MKNVLNVILRWKTILIIGNVYENVKNGHILNDHVSSMEEYHLLLDRITERITNTKKPYWHYYGNVISKEDAVTLLHNR